MRCEGVDKKRGVDSDDEVCGKRNAGNGGSAILIPMKRSVGADRSRRLSDRTCRQRYCRNDEQRECRKEKVAECLGKETVHRKTDRQTEKHSKKKKNERKRDIRKKDKKISREMVTETDSET